MNEVEVVIKGRDTSGPAFKSATGATKEYGKSVGDLTEKADNGERGLIGLHDSVDGVATIMQGPGKAGIAGYIQGWADLAGGMANFVIPALGKFTLTNIKSTASTVAGRVASIAAAAASKAWAAAQWVLNAALRANPIMIVVTVVTALVAAVILAYKHSETFRKVVDAAGRAAVGAFRAVLGAVQNVVGWVRRNWPLLLAILTGPIGIAVLLIVRNLGKITAFVKGIPGAFRGAFNGVKKAITDAVEGAVRWALGRLGDLMRMVEGIPGRIKNAIGGALGKVADFVNPFAHGGVVGAATGGIRGNLVRVGEHGSELVRLPVGSRVYPHGAGPSGAAGGGAVVVELRVTGRSDDLLVKWLRTQLRTGVIAV